MKAIMKAGLLFAFFLNASANGQSSATASCKPTDIRGNEFVPSTGQVQVAQDNVGRYIYQWMYWHQASRLKWMTQYIDTTYEPDAFFYNYDGKAYGTSPTGYWASDMPSPYVDTQFGDSSGELAVTIGSGDAKHLQSGRWYYTVTRMNAGAGASSWVKLSSQRGVQKPIGCTSTWCSFGCDATNNFFTLPFQQHFSAPGCMRYWWNYSSTTTGPC
jgi:hypothetical protein